MVNNLDLQLIKLTQSEQRSLRFAPENLTTGTETGKSALLSRNLKRFHGCPITSRAVPASRPVPGKDKRCIPPALVVLLEPQFI